MADNLYAAARQTIRHECDRKQLTVDERQVTVYSLLALTVGVECEDWHVHDAWGVTRVLDRPDHPDLVGWPQVPDDIRAYDRPFRDVVRTAAVRLVDAGWIS